MYVCASVYARFPSAAIDLKRMFRRLNVKNKKNKKRKKRTINDKSAKNCIATEKISGVIFGVESVEIGFRRFAITRPARLLYI